MANDGSISFVVDIDAKDAAKELNKLKRKIEESEGNIASMEKAKSPLVEQAQRLQKSMQQARADVERFQQQWVAGVSGADQAQASAQARVAQMEKEYQGVVAQIDKIDDKLIPAYEKLDRMKDSAGDLEKQMAAAASVSGKLAKMMEKMDHRFSKSASRLIKTFSRVAYYSIAAQAFSAMQQWVKTLITVNEDARESLARLKAAFLMLVQPLVDVVIPTFVTIADFLSGLIYMIGSLFAAAQGKTAEEAAAAAKALNDEMNVINGVGTAAKKAANSLAAFDEINVLKTAKEDTDVLPDFSSLSIPDWMKKFTADLAVKIKEIRFSWDEGTLAESADAWLVGLTAVLGTVIGGSFGGVSGSMIGLGFGLVIGLALDSFLDKTSNPATYKEMFFLLLSGLLGAVIGGRFAGLTGGVVGAAIGIVLGIAAIINGIEFRPESGIQWDKDRTLIVALSSILGAVAGGIFGGLKGGAIGLALGALISFAWLEFENGNVNTEEALASLRLLLVTLLGAMLGAKFGGLSGAVIGVTLGLLIGFGSVTFDKDVSAATRQKAKNALFVVMTGILGAIIGGLFGAGSFVGILVGGLVGVSIGLAIEFGISKIDTTAVDKIFDQYSSVGSIGVGITNRSTAFRTMDIPQLATGAVIPPNREFLAVLGDQSFGNNIEAPESLIRQIVREEAGGMNTELLREILQAVREAGVLMVDGEKLTRRVVRHINNMTVAAGESVLVL